MITNLTTLKKAFRLTLVAAGITQSEWAKRNKVRSNYVTMILSGHLKSSRMVERINNFIRGHLSQLKADFREIEETAE